MTTPPSKYLGNLVDMDHGEVSREIFASGEIYQHEQKRLFTLAWLFIGHESQIPSKTTWRTGTTPRPQA
jgi:hypothetical protein